MLCLCVALALHLHAHHGAVVRPCRFRLRAVKVLGEARHVRLLPLLQHIAVESRADARGYHHAHRKHDAHPGAHQAERHTLIGVHRRQRVEQHHARGADDDGPFHPLIHAFRLHLEIHEQRSRANEQEAQGEQVFQVKPTSASHHGYHAAHEVPHQHPVAQHRVLPVVYLHAHAREHIHEHRARIQYHQQEEEHDAILYAPHLEGIEEEVGRFPARLHIDEQRREHHAHRRRYADALMGKPVIRLAIHHDIDERAHHDAEDDHVAKFAESYREAFLLIPLERHRDEDDEYRCQHRRHHEVINVLPFIFIRQPRREPGAQLSQNHEEEVDGRHACRLLLVELVPSRLVLRLVARRDVFRSLYAEAIFYQREEVAHHQHIAQESHDQAAQCQDEDAVRLGADIAQDIHDAEPHHAHHLLIPHSHQVVEEGRESRHTHRRHEAHELYVL